MKAKKSSLVVTNKLTYLWLLSIPVALVKTGFDAYHAFSKTPPLIGDFIFNVFITLMFLAICISLFVKLNTSSAWLNPDHPSPND